MEIEPLILCLRLIIYIQNTNVVRKFWKIYGYLRTDVLDHGDGLESMGDGEYRGEFWTDFESCGWNASWEEEDPTEIALLISAAGLFERACGEPVAWNACSDVDPRKSRNNGGLPRKFELIGWKEFMGDPSALTGIGFIGLLRKEG